AVRARVDREQHVLDAMRSRPVLADPHRAVDVRERDVTDLRSRIRRCLTARLDRAGDDIRHTAARVRALSPAATLARGYAVVQRGDGTVVRRPGDVPAGERLRVRLAEGELTTRVVEGSG
ncbi:MAG: exodeoxyribonuclease VII large subunit, partial [Actinomycetota bacterium]|nr:exodeoxyribonuclease VII large subunit [Actinomycetota bacterium]